MTDVLVFSLIFSAFMLIELVAIRLGFRSRKDLH